MNQVKSYEYENPDDPSEHGLAYVCNGCGESKCDDEEWAANHQCDPAKVDELDYWKEFYNTCEACHEKAYDFIEDLGMSLCAECERQERLDRAKGLV